MGTSVSSRTITARDLNNLIEMALGNLSTCLDHPEYSCWKVTSMSQKEAQRLLVNARRRARRHIARLETNTQSSGISQWIAYAVNGATCQFAVWLRSQAGWETQQREAIELHCIAILGVEIKRLGFQLDR
jgi:hypothetical protein